MKKICLIMALIMCTALGGCKKQEIPSVSSSESTSTETAASDSQNLPEPAASIENLEEPLGTADVFGEESEYAAHFVFKTDKDVKNFRFFKVDMTYNEESNRLTGTPEKEYGFRETLNAEEEVVLIGETGEIMPFLAVSYESLNGNVYYYAIEISGEDGHAFLTPFDIVK